MEKINSEITLRNAILQLENKQAEEGKILKEQFLVAYESIKPINLIKSTFHEVSESTDLKTNLVNTSVGLAAGYLSKALFEGVTNSPLRKLLGTALMFGITNVVAKNPEVVKTLGNGVIAIVRGIAVNAAHHTAASQNGSTS
jgi:hypothetical protein